MSSLVDRLVEGFNDWLASRAAFVQTTLLTLAWTVAVVLGWDPHGFVFLYFATAVSFVTQATLAIIARRAQAEARIATEQNAHAEKIQFAMLKEIDAQTELLEQQLQNQADTLRALLTLLEQRTP